MQYEVYTRNETQSEFRPTKKRSLSHFGTTDDVARGVLAYLSPLSPDMTIFECRAGCDQADRVTPRAGARVCERLDRRT